MDKANNKIVVKDCRVPEEVEHCLSNLPCGSFFTFRNDLYQKCNNNDGPPGFCMVLEQDANGAYISLHQTTVVQRVAVEIHIKENL